MGFFDFFKKRKKLTIAALVLTTAAAIAALNTKVNTVSDMQKQPKQGITRSLKESRKLQYLKDDLKKIDVAVELIREDCEYLTEQQSYDNYRVDFDYLKRLKSVYKELKRDIFELHKDYSTLEDEEMELIKTEFFTATRRLSDLLGQIKLLLLKSGIDIDVN